MPGTPRKTAKAAPAKATKAAPRKTAPRSVPSFQDSGYNLGTVSTEDLFDLVMPSGQRCQARRPGVQGLIAAGVLDSFDQLTALVQTEHIGPKSTASQGRITKETKEAAGKALMEDPSKMTAGFEMIDSLVAYVVTQPALWVDYRKTNETQEDWERREAKESDLVPVRNVRVGDKLFLVQWAVGGSADLAAFREGLGVDLDALESVKVLQQ